MGNSLKQGSLTTFNSEEAVNARGLYGLGGAIGIKAIEELILNHFEKKEEIDGYTVYTIDGAKLDIPGRGEMYCVIVGNDTTHDNIIIITDNKDITLHMAKSIHYKNANTTTPSSNNENIVSTNNQNNNDSNNKNKYTEEDLARASEAGYDSGYSDGYLDSFDEYYYDDSTYETVETSSDSGSSGSSADNVETTEG